MMAVSFPSWWQTAPALRFLALFLLAWVGVRLAAPLYIGQETQAALVAAPQVNTPQGGTRLVGRAQPVADAMELAGACPVARDGSVAATGPSLPHETQRAMLDHRRHSQVAQSPEALTAADPLQLAAVEPAGVVVSRRDVAGEAVSFGAVDGTKPVSASGRAGWSLSAWALVREKTAVAQRRVFAGELAGSQLGARLAYGLGDQGAVQLYGRASAALYQPEQSETAFGVSYRPVAALPLDMAVERRQKIGRDGRNAMAAMVVGGVSGKVLPLGFQLDAYAQAGVVGLRSQDAFVDGALVVDRSLRGGQFDKAVRFGLMAAGAAQPQVARLDVGPRVTLPLPQLGQGMRVALDYRSRIWGDAEPKNGPALTIGMDF